MSETYVTAKRAAKIAGCYFSAVMRAVKTGSLAATRVDRSTILIALSDLRAWQKAKAETPVDPVLLDDAAKGLRRYRP